MRLVGLVASTILAALVAVTPGRAEKRVALVIGNASYQTIPSLPNPRNDAEDIGRALTDLGFNTILAADLDRNGMNDALDRFSRMMPGADIALVYYAGHGMQFVGRNYLLPVDAKLLSTEDVNRFRLMPLDDVLDVLEVASGARIIILDACRNNPVEEDLKRNLASALPGVRAVSPTRGLARISASNGLIVVYATQANQVASDGVARNSPFTAAFLRHVRTPDLDLRQMLFRVQDEVDRMTNGRQRPELLISLVGEFKLKAPATEQHPSAAAQIAPTQEDASKVSRLNAQIGQLSEQLALEKAERDRLQSAAREAGADDAQRKIEFLNQQIAALRKQLTVLGEALDASEKRDKESQLRLSDLGQRLNVAMAQRVQELALAQRVQELSRYRSDFFGRLRAILGNRPDIRIVGDRFVLQAEIFFDAGQAVLRPDGRGELDKLAAALNQLEKQIPTGIAWVLRIDGHTDVRPIASAQFPSNWALSSARAISVVQYLVGKGVSPQHLVAAGSGEFQPLDTDKTEEAYRRNRRIELKLTER
jgi:chemotaxis protein MotB